MVKTDKDNVFKVVANFTMNSPCCDADVVKFGTTTRLLISDDGTKLTLIIRRLQSKKCKKIHNELPDIVVSYKHHCAKTVKGIIEGNKIDDLGVPCEISTIYRITPVRYFFMKLTKMQLFKAF
jgi:hypothetical protein